VPAREEPRVGPQLHQQLEGVLDAGGALVLERGWYLQRSLSSCMTVSRRYRGLVNLT
jgi:hypothetical protein